MRKSFYLFWCKVKYFFKWKLRFFFRDVITFKHVRVICFNLKNPAFRFYSFRTGRLSLSTTWYDEIPYGWQKGFGKQLCKDLKEAYKKDKQLEKEHGKRLTWKKAIYWEQIKEKYGGLRLYASSTPYIMEVLEKYEEVSYDYCIVCGKPATRWTLGWINYICDDCAKLCNHYSIPLKDEDEYYKDKDKYFETHKEDLEAHIRHEK